MKTYDRKQLDRARSDGSAKLIIEEHDMRCEVFRLGGNSGSGNTGRIRGWVACIWVYNFNDDKGEGERCIYQAEDLGNCRNGVNIIEVWLWLHGFRPSQDP